MTIELTEAETAAADAALFGDIGDPVALMAEAGQDVSVFFENGIWSSQDFRRSDISNVSFRGADLRGAKFLASQLPIVLLTKPRFPPFTDLETEDEDVGRNSPTWRRSTVQRRDTLVPTGASALMERVRKNLHGTSARSMDRLLHLYSPYTQASRLTKLRNLLSRRGDAGSAPDWLRKFFAEAKAMSRYADIHDILRKGEKEALGSPLTKYEIAKANALYSDMEGVRTSAISEIHKEHSHEDDADDIIYFLASSDDNEYVRGCAARNLIFQNKKSEDYKHQGLSIYTNDPEQSVRGDALHSLSRLRSQDSEILGILVTEAVNLETIAERKEALIAISSMYDVSKDFDQFIIYALLRSIRETSDGAQHAAIGLFARIVKDLEDGENKLLDLYDNLPLFGGHYYLFSHLTNFYPSSERVSDIAEKGIRNPDKVEFFLLRRMIEFSSEHQSLFEKIRPNLFEIARVHRHPWIRRSAVRALGSQFKDSQDVRKLVSELLLDESSDDLRIECARILQRNIQTYGRAQELLRAYQERHSDEFARIGEDQTVRGVT